MINDCLNAGLPAPKFEQCGPHFMITLWRDWLTDQVMDKLGLNEQQKRAIVIVKKQEKITNTSYQKEFGVTKATASRHLESLVLKGVIQKVGTTGKGTYYILSPKGLTKGS